LLGRLGMLSSEPNIEFRKPLMSIKLSSLLKLSVASAVLISVGACKASDKGQGALESQSITALNLSKNHSER